MPSDTSLQALQDIHYYINLITVFVDDFTYEDFAEDLRTFHAVTRCLEIISEASRRLTPEIKAKHPTIRWEQMAAAGNHYRHEYEDVAQQVVWNTVQVSLPLLLTVVEQELAVFD